MSSQACAAAAVETLRTEGVTCAIRHVTFKEAGAALYGGALDTGNLGELYRAAGCVDDLARKLGIQDFTGVPRLPLTFSSTSSHGPRAGGFQKGEHTQAVLSRGWSGSGWAAGAAPSSAVQARGP